MKHLNLTVSTETHQRKSKTNLTWSEIIELGICAAEAETKQKKSQTKGQKSKA